MYKHLIVIIIFAKLYLLKLYADFLKEGIRLGILWFLMSFILGLIVFMLPTSFQMSLGDFFSSAVVMALVIPVITVGFGCLLNKKLKI